MKWFLWNTLKQQSTDFIKDNLEQLRSDVVYLCQLNEGSYLYFLIRAPKHPKRNLVLPYEEVQGAID